MGIVVLTPVDLLAFIALIVWAVVTSVMIWNYNRASATVPEVAVPDAEPSTT